MPRANKNGERMTTILVKGLPVEVPANASEEERASLIAQVEDHIENNPEFIMRRERAADSNARLKERMQELQIELRRQREKEHNAMLVATASDDVPF